MGYNSQSHFKIIKTVRRILGVLFQHSVSFLKNKLEEKELEKNMLRISKACAYNPENQQIRFIRGVQGEIR